MKEGKEAVPTREPDLKMELKRGSMRDKWGLTLVHRLVPPNRWLVPMQTLFKYNEQHHNNSP